MSSCGPFIGGYAGRSFKFEPTDKVYFQFKTKTVFINLETKKGLSINIYADDMYRLVETIYPTGNILFYKFSDTLSSKINNRRVEIKIINDYTENYSVFINPIDWIKKDTINALYRRY
jgi:hypothetical protein